ncbi:hypothetical protein GGTG_04031 [Gaeumannomyces tritici R3-111a-1]|uniref:Uncharacterized protein n=1 Tax=Gaeumannomyces tritici (strain R3-111a-1) TaxID=644352 RepID=J3NRY3_GAET3|nr:hypothetical protein GGTG_04031 [Gaeumannomyces tritici R3-111a-1]EJT78939.1 hypothetical protein GGTG_04031 [Gaeumannomyces tritici R3-111a-1]
MLMRDATPLWCRCPALLLDENPQCPQDRAPLRGNVTGSSAQWLAQELWWPGQVRRAWGFWDGLPGPRAQGAAAAAEPEPGGGVNNKHT